MQDGAPHVLRFLFVHGLTTVLLFGGLGVENRQIDLHEVPKFILFFDLWGLGHRGIPPIKFKNRRCSGVAYSR
jgi:hypothetical protein